MLEKLADYDEHLMEELLSDIEPPRDEVFDGLAKELSQGLVVPALLGSSWISVPMPHRRIRCTRA